MTIFELKEIVESRLIENKKIYDHVSKLDFNTAIERQQADKIIFHVKTIIIEQEWFIELLKDVK